MGQGVIPFSVRYFRYEPPYPLKVLRGGVMMDERATNSPKLEYFSILEEGVTQEGEAPESP